MKGKDRHVTAEAEDQGMLPQAKECWEPPEAARSKEVSSPRDIGGSMVLLTLWLLTPVCCLLLSICLSFAHRDQKTYDIFYIFFIF